MKNHLTPTPFILVLNGPSCAGKTTVSDIIFKAYGGIFKGKSDTIKRLISDYDYTQHHDLVAEMTLATIKVALGHGLSILKEGGLYGIEEMQRLAHESNTPIFIANIEAPWEVLVERFQERVANPIPGLKINTDLTRFREVYDEYLATKPATPYEFDSSLMTPDQIVSAIIELLTKSH